MSKSGVLGVSYQLSKYASYDNFLFMMCLSSPLLGGGQGGAELMRLILTFSQGEGTNAKPSLNKRGLLLYSHYVKKSIGCILLYRGRGVRWGF